MLVLAAAMLAGCCGIAIPPAGQGNNTVQAQPDTVPPLQDLPVQPVLPQNNTGGSNNTGQNQTVNATQDKQPGSQEDCATMTPTCGACVAKPGCGWCKSSNSCFAGSSAGPVVSSCPSHEWTIVESGCAAPAGGSTCAKQTNCASCLSGSGCKWCIQESKCADASFSDQCFGGWLNVSYQCNYASR
jgi:hypothetical protein